MVIAIVIATIFGVFAFRLSISGNVILGLMLILVAGGGYYQFSYKPAQEAAHQLSNP